MITLKRLKLCLFFFVLMQTSSNFASAIQARIVGGKQSQQSDYSYVVSIQKYSERDENSQERVARYKHVCAATIVDTEKILTAAHCVLGVTDYRNLSVLAGATNRRDPNNQRRMIKGCSVIADYKSGRKFGVNDIAVCKVSPALVDVVDADNVKPGSGTRVSKVRLDPSDTAPPKSGTRCRMVGWGSKFPIKVAGQIKYANDLQEIELTVLENEKCGKMWPK